MTIGEYREHMDRVRCGLIAPGGVYCIDPTSARSRQTAARSSPQPTSPSGRVGQWRPCGICSTLTYVFSPDDRCVECSALIAWQASLARQGLKVVWS